MTLKRSQGVRFG